MSLPQAKPYFLTFRLHEDETYDDRRNGLLDYVLDISFGPTWDEPTSFVAFRSKLLLPTIAKGVERIIDLRQDIVVVSLNGFGRAIAIGKANDENLLSAWPNIVFLPTAYERQVQYGRILQAARRIRDR